MIRILLVGKPAREWLADGIESYSKRLHKPYILEWAYMPHSGLDGTAARIDESSAILKKINPTEYVILLDEVGQAFDSPTITKKLEKVVSSVANITIIIGGAYGVDERVRQRANLVWSLSPLVFPHRLVRLILVEQLYRAQEITANRPYHHR